MYANFTVTFELRFNIYQLNSKLTWSLQSESTKQMEQTLRAKVKIFFKSEDLKKCFY